MKNIMRSILFEIMHSKMLIRIYLLMVAVMVLVGVLNMDGKGASEMLASMGEVAYEFSVFILALIVGIICGEDYKDKVAYYEVLSGHSRGSIFLARSLMGITIGAFFSTLYCFVPMIAGIIAGGWGNKLVLGDVIVRQLLFFFPLLRLGAFFAVLTYIIKNQYVMMAVGWLAAFSCAFLAGHKSFVLSIFNLGLLVKYEGWSLYNLDPNAGIVRYYTYDSSLSPMLITGTVIVSLLMTAFYLALGYGLFRRDELK